MLERGLSSAVVGVQTRICNRFASLVEAQTGVSRLWLSFRESRSVWSALSSHIIVFVSRSGRIGRPVQAGIFAGNEVVIGLEGAHDNCRE